MSKSEESTLVFFIRLESLPVIKLNFERKADDDGEEGEKEVEVSVSIARSCGGGRGSGMEEEAGAGEDLCAWRWGVVAVLFTTAHRQRVKF